MIRVFLVEDDAVIRETLRNMIPWDQLGYQYVGEAEDGEMALPLIQQAKPDLLVTDIWMPFMDGLALSKLVLREFPQIKILIISGYEDFDFARQAIDIGVERYLLKPIETKTFVKALEEIRRKIEGEYTQQNYLAHFRKETLEYEQYARRRFFERIADGRLSVQQIYEEAAQLGLDLRAQCYAIAFFSIPRQSQGPEEKYFVPAANLPSGLVEYFRKGPEYILLRWNLTTYAVIVKGDVAQMDERLQRCVAVVRQEYEALGENLDWYVGIGRPTSRLSGLSACFREVCRLWAYHYLLPHQHILTPEVVNSLVGASSDADLSQFDAAKANPDILRRAIQTADHSTLPQFVDRYIQSVAGALCSKPFCQYLMLSIQFCAEEYAASLNVSQADFQKELSCLDMIGQNVTRDDLKRYFLEILSHIVELRDNVSNRQGRNLLKQAMAYIDHHFAEESLSLNRVAQEINLSANYLSTVFSQETGMTFTEYVTGKRMEKARELLRTTTKRSGEVAAAVGYRDPHYFSFLFKKVQGCTPSDYRTGGKRISHNPSR